MKDYKTYTAEDEKCRNKVILGFILGILVGFGGFYAWNNNIRNLNEPQKEKGAIENITENTTKTSNQNSLDKINVPNQPTYNKVFISSLTLENTGWVAIHEDREGKPGNILGAQLFDKGTYDYGQIDLLRNMVAGGTYYAMIHIDDGDRSFDYKKDLPVKKSTGQIIMATFSTI